MGPKRGLNRVAFPTLLFIKQCYPKTKRPFRSALWRDFRLLPIEDNFAGSPAAHDVEAFLEVIHFEVVSDNWTDIKTRLNEARHLIPSFKHIAHHSFLFFKINALMAKPPSLGLKWGYKFKPLYFYCLKTD